MKKENNMGKWLFYGMMAAGLILLLLHCVVYDGNPLERILFWNPEDTFMDFYNSLYHTWEWAPYERGCIYPPFTYLIYGILRKLIPGRTVMAGSLAIRDSQTGQMAFMWYSLAAIVLLALLVYKNKKGRLREKCFCVVALLFSSPFLYTLERGNIVILTLVFLLFYLFYYDADNRVLRELALIALAMAVSTKIYPAVFGLLLLRDRRYKEAVRCVIYGILVFVLPFLFFGGFGNIMVLFQNIFRTSDEFAKLGYGYKVNITNTLGALADLMHIRSEGALKLIRYSPYVLLLLAAVGAYFVKERWKAVGILAALLAVIPNFSYIYTMIFLTLPLLLFLDKEPGGWMDIFYGGCFAAMFVPVARGVFEQLEGMYLYTYGTFLQSVALLAFVLALTAEGIADGVRLFCNRQKKRQKNRAIPHEEERN